jgi:hypothetical protein
MPTLQDDLVVDRYHLDYELLRQPTLYQNWAEKLARADTERLFAKERLEQVKATLYTTIRTYPERYGITRVTDAAIQAQVILEHEYIQAVQEMLHAREEHAIINTYVEALQHKKSAIENCVRLFLAGYYTQPSVSTEWHLRMADAGTDMMTSSLNTAPSRLLRRVRS